MTICQRHLATLFFLFNEVGVDIGDILHFSWHKCSRKIKINAKDDILQDCFPFLT